MSESKKITKKQSKTLQNFVVTSGNGDDEFIAEFLKIFKFNSDGKITSPDLSRLSKEDAEYCCKWFIRFIELKNSKDVTIEMKEGCADKIYDIDRNNNGYFLAAVGGCYKDGEHLKRDYKKALKFLKKAVENSSSLGAYRLFLLAQTLSNSTNLEELKFAKEACEIIASVDPKKLYGGYDIGEKKTKVEKLLPQINDKIEELSSKLKKSSASTKALSTTSSHKSSTKSRRFRSRKDESKSKHHNKDNDEYDNEYDSEEEEETPPISREQKQNSKPVKKASSSKFNGNNNNNEPNNTTNSKLMRSPASKSNDSSIKSNSNIQPKKKIDKQKNSNTNNEIDGLDKIEEEEAELTSNSGKETQNQQPEQNRLNLSSTNNVDDNESSYEYFTIPGKVRLSDKRNNSNIANNENTKVTKNNDEESDSSIDLSELCSVIEQNKLKAVGKIDTNSRQPKRNNKNHSNQYSKSNHQGDIEYTNRLFNSPSLSIEELENLDRSQIPVSSSSSSEENDTKIYQQQKLGELRDEQETIIKQTNKTQNQKDTKQSQSYQKISDQFYRTIKDLNKAFIKRENDKVTNEKKDGSTEFNLDKAKQTLKNNTKQYLETSIRLNRQKQAEVEKIYDNKYKKTKKQQAIVSPPTGTLKAITSFIKDKTKKLNDARTITSVEKAKELDGQNKKVDSRVLNEFRNSTLPEGGFGGEFYITGDNKIVIELDKEGFTGRSAKEYGMGDLINNEKINITIQLEGQSDNYLLNQQLAIATAFKNDPLYAFNRFIDNEQYIVNINGTKDNNAEKLKQLFYVMSEAKKMEINDRINLERINGSLLKKNNDCPLIFEKHIIKTYKSGHFYFNKLIGVKYNEANPTQKLLYNQMISRTIEKIRADENAINNIFERSRNSNNISSLNKYLKKCLEETQKEIMLERCKDINNDLDESETVENEACIIFNS